MIRSVAVEFDPPEETFPMPEIPGGEGPSKKPWLSRWVFERDGKRYRMVVTVQERATWNVLDTIDAREWIERLPTEPIEHAFTVHIEAAD